MRVFKHPVSLLLKFKFGEIHENFKEWVTIRRGKKLNKLDIETLNFTKILKETEDPLIYFPLRSMIHFNKYGYSFLGDVIINKILK